MKSFFEQYGFVILATVVVIILIAMATPIGGVVQNQVSNVATNFKSTESRYEAYIDDGSYKEGDAGNAKRIADTLIGALENQKINFQNDDEVIAVVVGKEYTKVLASGLTQINGKTYYDDQKEGENYKRVKELLKQKAVNLDTLKNEGTLSSEKYFYAIFMYTDGTVKYGAGDQEGFEAYKDDGRDLETHSKYWREHGFNSIEEALQN